MLIELAGKIWKAMPWKLRTFLARRLQPTFTSSAAGIITNKNGEVLLLDHVLRPSSGWGLPGGFLEKGEQPADALRRELREEIGLELTDIQLYRVRTMRRHIEVIFIAKAVGEAAVKSLEIKQLQWFAVGELPPEMNLNQHFLIRTALGYKDPSF